MTNEQLEELKKEYLSVVIGQPISTTWPNHLITDIILVEVSDKNIPHVTGENKEDGSVYNKALHTWLSDNGY